MQAFNERLENYFSHLMQLCSTWSEWICQQEQAAVDADFSRLNLLTQSADQLLAHIRGLHTEREEILQDAQEQGIEVKTLQDLALTLPNWSSPAGRERIRAAQRHLDQLRRLHLAIWVLISHCERFTSATMQILSRGEMEASVYASTGRADTSGGQLLDTQA